MKAAMEDMRHKCKMGCEAEMKKVKGDQYDNGFLNQCMEGCMPKKDDGKKGGDKKGGDKKGGDKKGDKKGGDKKGGMMAEMEGKCKNMCMEESMKQKGGFDSGVMDQCMPGCMSKMMWEMK